MKDQPKTLTPKLRFPEFKAGPEWARTKLSSVLTDHGLMSDGKCEVHSVSLTNGVVPQIEHMGRSFAATKTDHYSLVRPFDIVYTRSPLAIFKLGIVKQHKRSGNAIVSPLYGVFTPKNKHLGSLIEAYFESPSRSLRYLDPLAQKGAKNTIHLSNDRFLSGSLYLPADEDEQRKIAACLTSLDELLAAEGRKLEALRTHMKGLMQQLFPRPGETRPRLRFPEFRDGPEWDENSFGSLYDFKPTNNYSRDQLNYDSGDVRNIHYGDIHTKFAASFYIDRERVPFVNASALPRNIRDEAFCHPGDMVFADASEDLADVGKSIEVIDVKSEKVLSGSHTILARRKNSAIAVGFGAYLFKSRDVRARIEKEAQGTKVMSISPSRLAGVGVRYPSNHAEQERIAACLSSLDALIAAQSRKLDGLRAQKKGLMQQLFPSPEEA